MTAAVAWLERDYDRTFAEPSEVTSDPDTGLSYVLYYPPTDDDDELFDAAMRGPMFEVREDREKAIPAAWPTPHKIYALLREDGAWPCSVP